MPGTNMETELKLSLELLDWRVTFLGEKGPAVDYLCIFPDPEKVPSISEPGMTVYVQVKSDRQPTASAIGIKNLTILQSLQVPVFWYCISEDDKRSRAIYYLSPDWLKSAVVSQSGRGPTLRCKLPRASLKGAVRGDRPCKYLHRFIRKWYGSFLESIGEAALAPFARQSESKEAWAKHVEAATHRLRGLRPNLDVEACLTASRLYRIAGKYDKAAKLLGEAKELLRGVPLNDTRHSRYCYEMSYCALVQEDYRRARKWAKLSSTDAIRKPIADSVIALSHYLPVLKSGRLPKGYRDKVLRKLRTALNELLAGRPLSRDDRELRSKWLDNLRVHLAEANAVYAILAHKEIETCIVRDFQRVRERWLKSRLIDAVASCLFVEALLAMLRKDRSAHGVSVVYLHGVGEGDFDRLRSKFIDKLRGP
jgi:hypothetical protein